MAADLLTIGGQSAGWRQAGPWHRHLLLLGIAAALLLTLGARDVAAILAIWERTGAFHHCFLIPPILVWLVWQRRGTLALLSPEYSLRGAGLVAMGGLLWLGGAAAYVDLLRQAGLVIAGQGLVIALLGWPAARALTFPLGFALFLIPAGSEFEPLLQIVTAHIAVALLHLVGTPATLEGVFIATPAGLFRVAEACSGTAFLLAMAAYGALAAMLCFEGWKRRIAFMAAAMLAAVLTNGLRAFGIMQLATLTSIRNPAVQDHLLYGWLLFAVVLALLMLASSRWFDRDGDAPLVDARSLQGVAHAGSRGQVVLPIILAALLLPRLWLAVTEPMVVPPSPPPAAPAIPGWQRIGGISDWHPHYDGATWIGQWRYGRTGRIADFALIIFDRQREGRELVAFGQGAAGADGPWSVAGPAPAPVNGRGELLRGPDGQQRHAVTFYSIDGIVTGSRIVAKLASVRARLFGGDPAARALIIVSPDAAAVTDFLKAGGSAQEMADRARPMR